MRIISGKIVLAARIDLSKSNPNGELGETYKQEILTKIDKLLTPPQQSIDKSLPKPIEMKSKRAGRKYQKLRAKFEMSELRKAQNKLQFGKQEDTIMNGLGEEIGLGMIKSGGGGGGNGVSISSGRIRKLPPPPLKGAKSNLNLSKNMMNRLNEKKEINPIKAFDEFNLELFSNQKRLQIQLQN